MNPLRLVLIAVLFIFSISESPAQIRKIMNDSPKRNKVVYRHKKVKLFEGQLVHISTLNSATRLQGLALIDSTRSNISDIQEMSNTIIRHNAEPTLSIDMKVIYPEPGKALTVLLLKNPFKKKLSYKARIYSPNKKRYIRTAVLPIMPGVSGVQTWTFPVSSIIVYKFKLSKD